MSLNALQSQTDGKARRPSLTQEQLAKHRVANKAWRDRNPPNAEQKAKNAAANKAWRDANKARTDAYREKRKAKKRDEVNSYRRQWRKDNPEITRAQAQRKRARIKADPERLAREIQYREEYRARNIVRLREAERKRKRTDRVRKATPRSQPLINGEEVRVKILNRNEIFAAASKAISSRIPTWRRDDIISDIVLAVLEGSLAHGEIALKAKEFVRAYNRKFDDHMQVLFNDSILH